MGAPAATWSLAPVPLLELVQAYQCKLVIDEALMPFPEKSETADVWMVLTPHTLMTFLLSCQMVSACRASPSVLSSVKI